MKLQFKRLHMDAKLPTRGSEHAAGLDLYSIESNWIPADWPCPVIIRVQTGISVAIPDGYYGRIAPRSGLAAKFSMDVLAGVVDGDYRGELIVILAKLCAGQVEITRGDRIAQLIIEKIATPEPEWADELPATVRGDGGFGSSGV